MARVFQRDIIERVGFFVADVLGRLPLWGHHTLDPDGVEALSSLLSPTFPSLIAWLPEGEAQGVDGRGVVGVAQRV